MSLSLRSFFTSNKSKAENYSEFNNILNKIINLIQPESSEEEEEKDEDEVNAQAEKNLNILIKLLKSFAKLHQKIKQNNLNKIYQEFLKSNLYLMKCDSLMLLHANFNVIISDMKIIGLLDSDIKKGILAFDSFISGSFRIILDEESDSEEETDLRQDKEKKPLSNKNSLLDIEDLLNFQLISDEPSKSHSEPISNDKGILNPELISDNSLIFHFDSVSDNKIAAKPESILDKSNPETKSECQSDDEINSCIISAFIENMAEFDIEEKKGKSSSKLFTDYNANLYEYPKKPPHEKLTPGHVLTVGDMHGNTLKLIYILIRHQILDIDEAKYNELIRIYDTPVPKRCEKKSDVDPEFDKRVNHYTENMKQFDKIINDAFDKMDTKKIGKLRFLGDLISERGHNDYFTFKIIEWFFIKNLARIIWSNHDYDALIHIYNLNHPDKKISPWFLEEHAYFKQSFLNLIELIELKVVRLEWVTHVIYNCYKPLLQLISYAREEGSHKNKYLTIYTHAPTKFLYSLHQAIPYFMVKQSISDPSLSHIIRTIDAINKKLIDSKELTNPQFRPAIEPFINDRLAALASEDSDELKRIFPATLSDYFTTFIAGHDFPLKHYKAIDSNIVLTDDELETKIRFREDLENTCSLDNFFGKNLEYSKKGVYFSRLSSEPPSLQLMLYIEAILPDIQNVLNIPKMYELFTNAFTLYEKNKDHKAFQKNWQEATNTALLILKKSEQHSPLVSHSVYPMSSQSSSQQLSELLKEVDKQISGWMIELLSDSNKESKSVDDSDFLLPKATLS